LTKIKPGKFSPIGFEWMILWSFEPDPISDVSCRFSGSPVLIQTPPPSPVQINSRVPQPGPYSVSVEHTLTMSKDETAATVLPERVWQECIHGGPPGCNQPASNTPHEFTGQWDFVDPIKRANCTCSK
jgi:hypothetical protein